jgi:hypothetical protein
MSERAPTRSDGVTFRVDVVEQAGGEAERRERVFEHVQKAATWTPHTVDLSRWASKPVRLKFISDAGPRDNATTDHSHWGDVCVVGAGGRKALTPARRFMTWANARPFASGFYFSDVRGERVDLEFVVEGAEAVRGPGHRRHGARRARRDLPRVRRRRGAGQPRPAAVRVQPGEAPARAAVPAHPRPGEPGHGDEQRRARRRCGAP